MGEDNDGSTSVDNPASKVNPAALIVNKYVTYTVTTFLSIHFLERALPSKDFTSVRHRKS